MAYEITSETSLTVNREIDGTSQNVEAAEVTVLFRSEDGHSETQKYIIFPADDRDAVLLSADSAFMAARAAAAAVFGTA